MFLCYILNMSWFSSTQSRFFLVFMSRTQYSVFWFSSPQCFLFKAGLLICFYVMYTVSFDSVVHSVCWYVFMSRTRCLSIQLYTVSVDMFSCHVHGVFRFSCTQCLLICFHVTFWICFHVTWTVSFDSVLCLLICLHVTYAEGWEANQGF